ncbi:MAG: hypothetical protein HY645_14630 [Acidobacteria bacterium]|nr:hypothetical protein [Acidobacteriota bacterium]
MTASSLQTTWAYVINHRRSTKGAWGVYDHFVDSKGGVALLYLGDLQGLNNLRRAYSAPGDNGWTFVFDRGDILGDAGADGGSKTYVDPKSIQLPDGRRRLFVMKGGQGAPPPAGTCCDIFSFISSDDGKTFTLEAGARLSANNFSGIKLYSLNDPWVIQLADGRYRMYVAALADNGVGGNKWVIVSATTPVTTFLHFAQVGAGATIVRVALGQPFCQPVVRRSYRVF